MGHEVRSSEVTVVEESFGEQSLKLPKIAIFAGKSPLMKWYRFVARLSHLSFYCLEKVYVVLRKTVSFIQAVQKGFWLEVMGQ